MHLQHDVINRKCAEEYLQFELKLINYHLNIFTAKSLLPWITDNHEDHIHGFVHSPTTISRLAICRVPIKWRKQISGLFSTINTQKIKTYCFTINELLHSFSKKTRLGKCYLKHFLLIYYNHQCREIKLKKILDHLLGFHEHTSQIQDFFSTSVQFQDFSGPEKSKLKFQDFSGLMGTLYVPFLASLTFIKAFNEYSGNILQ